MPQPLFFIMSKETLLAKIKALEPCMQAYIHELETRCDPSGDVRTIADLREQVIALCRLLDEKGHRSSIRALNYEQMKAERNRHLKAKDGWYCGYECIVNRRAS